jgi:hypothetical protein
MEKVPHFVGRKALTCRLYKDQIDLDTKDNKMVQQKVFPENVEYRNYFSLVLQPR